MFNKGRNSSSQPTNKFFAAISRDEMCLLTLNKEGRETTKLRVDLISKDFDIIDVSSTITVKAAEIRHSSATPMADSLIATTSIVLTAVCMTDDPHFEKIDGLSRRWI